MSTLAFDPMSMKRGKAQTTKKTTALRQLIQSPKLEFLMEAHSGLSAKIVEEAGFSGIWASGLSISAACGVRDNNEASWTQVLEIVEFMSDATQIPILLDGDTGYGNFNNMRRLVRKLEQRNVAGVCIEDKIFPKTNSFIKGEAQPLADIEEFAGKIRAGKEAQLDDDFCIVARVEAFIAGWGLEEALRRAEAYRKAGADAILIHSQKARPTDIETFMKEWGNRHPIVIVPTKYYSTPTERFEELGISVAIWANHLVRSSVTAMQKTAAEIFKDRSLINVEDKVVPVSELFRLQGDAELQQAEEQYLPKRGRNVKSVVLAASRGAELGDMTLDKPKAMIKIQGQPILHRLIHEFNSLGIKDVTVVRGYKKDVVTGTNFKAVDNDQFESTKELASLYLAREQLSQNCLIAYGDTLFRNHILRDALSAKGDFVVVVDAGVRASNEVRDYVRCNRKYSNDFFNIETKLEKVMSGPATLDAHGEWTGILYVSDQGAKIAKETLEALSQRSDFAKLSMVDLMNEIISRGHQIDVVYTKGGWIGVNEAIDLERAGSFYN